MNLIAIYKSLIRPLLFCFEPETAHRLTVATGRSLARSEPVCHWLDKTFSPVDPVLRTRVCGLDFRSPIGIAAGLDKNGEMAGLLTALGSGFVEIGSVSRHPSQGNARPRLFRLPKDQAIVVRYGNPSLGAEAMTKLLSQQTYTTPLGINLVPTNRGAVLSVDEIATEFSESAQILAPHGDYFTLNLSCPNVKSTWHDSENGADVSDVLPLWLDALNDVGVRMPVFLKLEPTTEYSFIERLLKICEPYPNISGFIFNLPKTRNYQLLSSPALLKHRPGAISGPPTRNIFDDVLAKWYQVTRGSKYVLVGSGGVYTAHDAYRKIRLGASLIQVYTVLIYQGPGVIAHLNRDLANLLRNDGFESISDAVGIDGLK